MTVVLCPRCRLWHVPGRPETAQPEETPAEVMVEFIRIMRAVR